MEKQEIRTGIFIANTIVESGRAKKPILLKGQNVITTRKQQERSTNDVLTKKNP